MKRQTLRVIVLVAVMAWVPAAEAQIPVTDVAHILETILQYIQQLLDYVNQIEQLYHQSINLAKLAEFKWRDPGVKTGEFIWGRSMRLAGSPPDLELPPAFETLAFLLPDIEARMRKVFTGVSVFKSSLEEEGGFGFETNLERLAYGIDSEQELYARSMSILGDHLRNIVGGVLALKDLREAVEAGAGNEVQNELRSHFDAFQAEEALLKRQLDMMQMNLAIMPQARRSSELGQALATLEEIFSSVDPGGAPRRSQKGRGLRAVD